MNFNVKGHLRDKNGIWHMVLNYTAADGKRKTPSKTTGLPVKGNKKKAEAMLLNEQRELEKELRENAERKDVNHILFSDYILDWLKTTKTNIEMVTYSSYQYSVEKVIAPYFKKRKIKLKDLKAKDRSWMNSKSIAMIFLENIGLNPLKKLFGMPRPTASIALKNGEILHGRMTLKMILKRHCIKLKIKMISYTT